MPVSINISARHLQHPGFGAWMVQCLARYPLVAPRPVELEITGRAALYGLAPVAVPWMHGQRLRDEISYEQLCRLFPEDLRSFAPTLADARFDLDLVAGEIVAEVAQALARRA